MPLIIMVFDFLIPHLYNISMSHKEEREQARM